MATAEIETKVDPLAVWLKERRSIIGASESPAILGYGYSDENAWTVWARKRGLIEEKPDNEMLEYGREIQPVTLRMFERRTGIKVRYLGEFTIQRHPAFPWMGCTLDGAADLPEGLAVIEAKNVGHYSAREWEADEPPLRVQIQVQHQLAVTGGVAGFAAATIGGNRLRWRRVDRNDHFIDVMTKKLAEFWELVLTGTPPAIDASAGCKEVISLMHPDDSGDTIELPDVSAVWDAELQKAEAELDRLKDFIDERKNRLKMAIGDATFGVLPDGGRYSFKTQTVREHVRRESTFRVLKRLNK
jgi:putative phage-type endonuclease